MSRDGGLYYSIPAMQPKASNERTIGVTAAIYNTTKISLMESIPLEILIVRNPQRRVS